MISKNHWPPRNEPGARPEDGVTRYYSDATQGPVLWSEKCWGFGQHSKSIGKIW